MDPKLTRRGLLGALGKVAAAGVLADLLGGATQPPGALKLPNLFAPTERDPGPPPAPQPNAARVGFAVVGLGHLALEEILPAFAQSKSAKVTALVSGDAVKAAEVARRYGVPEKGLYSYATYDKLRDDPTVDAIYIVLPNSLHAEFTVRGAKAGKHILCEKPMATTVSDCKKMIDACAAAQRHLMIAYRLQYEPYNRNAVELAQGGKLGALRGFEASNGQDVGDPSQWRLNRALAGGGALPDVGIYCLNAARYLTGEEPSEVFGMSHATPGDPRFKEVEETFDFLLRFPSGLLANCTSGYGNHRSQTFRLMGADGWLAMDPAFAYSGLRQRWAHKSAFKGAEEVSEEHWDEKSQFARELDHFAHCITDNVRPRTPGEEGLQDLKLITALYDSAKSGKVVKLPPVPGKDAFRGPALEPA